MNSEIKQRIEQINRGEVPQGYKKTKIGIVPNEWECKKINEISFKLTEKAGSQKLEVLSITAGKGFVNQAEKFGKNLSGKQYLNYTVINKGDFSYNKGNSKKYPQGCIYVLEDREKAAVPNVFNSFRLHKQVNDYFKQLFIYGYLNKQLFKFINSGVRNDGLLNLYENDFYSCYLPVPPLHEQQKIADVLSTQDKVIKLKEKLVEEKKKQKKYLMQNLLTGKIRIKGFNDEWKKCDLGDLCKCLDNERIPLNSSDRISIKGEYPYYGANGVVDYINKYIFDTDIILLAEDGGNFEQFDSKAIAIFVNERCWVNNHAHVLKAKDRYSNMFIFYSLQHKDIRKYINGTTRTKLTKSDMEKIQIYMPTCKQEQTAIAEIFTTADKEIEFLEQELEQEKLKKKSLMQLLLTGIVRV